MYTKIVAISSKKRIIGKKYDNNFQKRSAMDSPRPMVNKKIRIVTYPPCCARVSDEPPCFKYAIEVTNIDHA
jgi:pyrimidine deaminase RibD-like protein